MSAAATAVVHKAISYATVSFRCPSGTPKPQTMATTNGTFAFRGDGTSFPVSCEIDVVASGYVRLTRDFTTACDQTAGPDRCRRTLLAIELVPLGKAISAPPSPSTPVPAPAPTPSGRDPGYLF